MADKIRALLAGNIRADEGDDSELRDSLRRFGWSRSFPALKDEHGAVLVGHRRLRIAAELGIGAVVEIVHFGEGDAADAERVKLALISNIGGKPMTAKDRQHIAEHLYGERQWTMQRIAEALSVSQRTISQDLRGLEVASKPARPKGGRPKGSKRTNQRGKKPSPQHDAARVVVREKLEADEPINPHKLQEETGISHVTIDGAILAEVARREALEEAAADPSLLSKSAQEKLAIATRQMERRLQGEFEQAVADRMAEALNDVILSRYRELKNLYDGVINRRSRGVMKPAEFRLVLSCLHPDSRHAVTDARLADAMSVLQKYKLSLVDESVEPTPPLDFPRTRAEWEARRQAVKAARRAKRTGAVIRR
jgi:ParB-like chromosome segregation protein Spo0J